MDRTERFYKIDQMLNDRKVVPLKDFLEELGISLACLCLARAMVQCQ